MSPCPIANVTLLQSSRDLIYLLLTMTNLSEIMQHLRINEPNSENRFSVLQTNIFLLTELNAFSASTSIIVSVFFPSNILYVVWITSSCPEHKHSSTLMMSFVTICNATFPAIFHKTSPITIGLKPGLSSYEISLYYVKYQNFT